MKSLLASLSIVMAMFFSSGCSTIYFHKGSSDSTTEMNEWHHNGILRLVEFSDPVDMANRCAGKGWETIKVEKGFIHGFVGSLTNGWYDPWSVSYSCKK